MDRATDLSVIPVPVKKYRGMDHRERFMSKVQVAENGCWLWTAGKNKWGYGKFTVCRKDFSAHRYSFMIHRGFNPELPLDHLCRNPACVNPDHLEPVTQRINLLRGNTFQAKNAAKTHCPKGHPYSEENTRYTSNGRQCRECTIISKEKKRRAMGCKIKGRYKTKREIAYRESVLP